jgi:hypothetical protein
MGARLRSWWQQIKQYRATILVVTIIMVVAIVLIIIGYRFDWTGFNGSNKSGKTLWDWLQLLIIPLALAIIAIFFNRAERKNEQRLASDNQQETALQAYLSEMSGLLLEKHLRESKEGDEVRTIARVLTLTILPRLDAKRKYHVLQFLYESKLIENGKSVIDMSGTDLSRASLSNANLKEADLREANLSGANLSGANLNGADLRLTNLRLANLRSIKLVQADLRSADLHGADLSAGGIILDFPGTASPLKIGANLFEANLKETDLSGTNLSGATVTFEQLYEAKSLQGATMPDGSIHP